MLNHRLYYNKIIEDIQECRLPRFARDDDTFHEITSLRGAERRGKLFLYDVCTVKLRLFFVEIFQRMDIKGIRIPAADFCKVNYT